LYPGIFIFIHWFFKKVFEIMRVGDLKCFFIELSNFRIVIL